MQKVAVLAFLGLAVIAPAWTKDMLAVLPFTGGEGETGETIAELFSFEKELTAVFTPVPRTSITIAIQNERRFQMCSGMTDPDTIAALGRQLGAQYVVAGSITTLGARKLLIIVILKIDELRQVAGDIQTYRSLSEIRGKLPAMAKTIAGASQREVSKLPQLAVPPVHLAGSVDKNDADTLAQLLAAHLVRIGKYRVYPRTKSLDQVLIEYNNQFNGDVADEYLPKVGQGDNPRLVLSVTARKLGQDTMFNAAVINLDTGGQEAGETVDYTSLEDGLRTMEALALKLTGQKKAAQKLEKRSKKDAEAALKQAEAARKQAEAEAEAAQQKAEAEAEAARQKAEAERKAAERKAALEKKAPFAKRNSLELVSVAGEWSGDKGGLGIELIDFHWSLRPFTSVGIGFYPFSCGGYSTLGFSGAVGASLYAGLVYPLTTKDRGFNARFYGDFLFSVQNVSDLGVKTGIGFATGLALAWGWGGGIDIRYRGVVYEGHYVNSLGIGFVVMFNNMD